MSEHLYILTGAPGTGKTAVLRGLQTSIRWVAEPARELLAEHPSIDVRRSWQQDPDVFVLLLLARSIRKYEDIAVSGSGSVVFDRGIPDCIAYALHLGADQAPSIAAAALYRYNPNVLITEPWDEIYTTDDERTMGFEATTQFHRHVVTAYEQSGYTLVEVPRRPIAQRVAFVEAAVS